jgi:hypothetical protein
MTPGSPRFFLEGLPSYFGGKGAPATVRRIINCLPPHDVYVEPFLGSGRILRHKRPALRGSIGMEADGNLCRLWQASSPPDVHVLHTDALRDLVPLIAALMTAGADPARIVVYCDPPYLVHTRRDPVGTYLHEWTDADHIRFLLMALRLPCRVLISHLPCPEYAEALQDWHTFTFLNTTRRGLQTEQLWCNYTPSADLHEYTFIGKNFRERERIKRQLGILRKRFDALPPAARIAALGMLEHRALSDDGHDTDPNTPPPCN